MSDNIVKSFVMPDGKLVFVPGGYELIHSATTEEEVKTFAVGGNLDKYGLLHVYAKVPELETEYYLAMSFSETQSFNWNYQFNQSTVAREYPYYIRADVKMENDQAFIEAGHATRYQSNTKMGSACVISSHRFKYVVLTSNTNDILLPIGTHLEVWGIRKGE